MAWRIIGYSGDVRVVATMVFACGRLAVVLDGAT